MCAAMVQIVHLISGLVEAIGTIVVWEVCFVALPQGCRQVLEKGFRYVVSVSTVRDLSVKLTTRWVEMLMCCWSVVSMLSSERDLCTMA